MRNSKTKKNEYFVENYDVTESVEYLLAEVKRDYEFKKQVEIQCGLCASNDILNKQAWQYKNKIADLEAKLAESESELEKQKEKYDKLYACYKKTSSEDLKDKYHLADEIEELQQQLAEKDETIENLRIDLKDWQDLEEKISTKYDKVVEKLAEKQKELEEVKKSRTYIMNFGDKVKEVQVVDNNQDKISFAVEQLENCRLNLIKLLNKKRVYLDSSTTDEMDDLFDNQIKQLKEGK